jgi:hypothetical protein
VQFVEGDYDTETSSPTYTFDYANNVPAIFTRFSEKEADDKIMVTRDFKVLIPAAKFPLTINEATNDTMVDDKGKVWNVTRYMGVTGESLHIFQVCAA